ncbi:MAG TPA: dihydrofolate reductase family protein [Chthoniobacterales bacterium]|jgi:riboflavin-specific deaminase-like protein
MQRPRVISNFAITADGKVSTRNHTPSGFTSARDKRRLLEIRSLGDALLVGRGTAEADNMSMTIPDEDLRRARVARGQSEHPIRALISNSGEIPPTLKVFTNTVAPTLVYSTEAMSEANRAALGAHAKLRLSPADSVPLNWLLNDLRANHGVRTVICEGGPTLVKALLAEDLLDEMYVTIAPKIFGGKDAPTMTGSVGSFLPEARHFRLKDLFVENSEAYCHYVRRQSR